MKRKTDFRITDDNNTVLCILKVGDQTFFGEASKNTETDPFPGSYSIGTRIAEARAYKEYYQYLIRSKKLELKGVKRVLYSTKTGRAHILNVYNAIVKEIANLRFEIYNCDNEIKTAIKSRELYIKSRQTDKKERDRALKTLEEGFKALNAVYGQND